VSAKFRAVNFHRAAVERLCLRGNGATKLTYNLTSTSLSNKSEYWSSLTLASTGAMARPNGGKLTIYVDCGQFQCNFPQNFLTVSVSPYSWFGFTNIRNFRPLLFSHGIEVCIEPFFLGGARDGEGNPYTRPPQAKAAFGQQDLALTSKLLGLKVVQPEVFPISSLFVSVVCDCIRGRKC